MQPAPQPQPFCTGFSSINTLHEDNNSNALQVMLSWVHTGRVCPEHPYTVCLGQTTARRNKTCSVHTHLIVSWKTQAQCMAARTRAAVLLSCYAQLLSYEA